MPVITTEVDVDVTLDDFSTEELEEEIHNRLREDKILTVHEHDDLIRDMYEAKTSNRPEEFERLLAQFFYDELGRIL